MHFPFSLIGLTDTLWGVGSQNVCVFAVTPFGDTLGEERKKIFSKLDTCGLISSFDGVELAVLFRGK